MLKATELRIGNYILSWEDGNQGNPVKVTAANLETLSKVGPHQEYMALKPIPLTPELLEKCGFVNKPTKNYPLSFEQESGDRDPDWTFRIWWWRDDICIEPFGRDNGHIGIQYLHQLQNLYFALTGEELSVNL